MKASLVVEKNQVTIREYGILEDEGICSIVAGSAIMGNPGITMVYEDDETYRRGHMIVVTAPDLAGILKFLDQAEIPVYILT